MKNLAAPLLVSALAALALAAPAFAADPQKAAASTDGEVVAQLCAINETEIIVAGVAEAKKVSGPVLDFATMLRKEHSQNLIDTQLLAAKAKLAPAETAATMAMHKKAAEHVASLSALDGDKLKQGFLDMMVAGHTEALAKLDGWIASAKSPELKKHLTDTRGHVAKHLDQAKKLGGKG
jgi:putative membrane protein